MKKKFKNILITEKKHTKLSEFVHENENEVEYVFSLERSKRKNFTSFSKFNDNIEGENDLTRGVSNV